MRTGLLSFAFITLFMGYQDNLKRMDRKFVEFRDVKYEMFQIYIDGHPIGEPVEAEKGSGLFYWLATALPDLEKLFRPKKERKPRLPRWLTGEPEKRKK